MNARGSLRCSDTSVTRMRLWTLTCVAARPMPFAAYMVSSMSSISSRNEPSTAGTGMARVRRRGSGNSRIVRRVMWAGSGARVSDSGLLLKFVEAWTYVGNRMPGIIRFYGGTGSKGAPRMAPTPMTRSRHPLYALAAAAAAAVALAMALPTGVATGQEGGIDRSVIPVAPDAPDRYVVQKGDTLWDISAKFLTDPWYWPEIWHINPQVANPHLIYPGDELALIWVDGRPQVTIARGGPVRLSPRVRENPLSEALNAIPYERIAAFMQRPAVLTRDQVEGAPYVAHARDHRLIASVGNDIYARRLADGAVGNRYSI